MMAQPSEVSALSEDDRTLIERMREGDSEAGSILFSKYIPVIYGSLYHTVRGATKDDLQSMTQAVCHTILEELGSYNPEFTVSTWVGKLVLRQRMQFLRDRDKKQGPLISLEESVETGDLRGRRLSDVLAGKGPDALDVLEEKEMLAYADALLRNFLATLETDQDREVFTNREFFGLSYIQIAQKHSLTLDAVKARLKRTRQKWVAFLTDHVGAE
jgi:RNA polymerase sigma factor (sigma-70 family)